MNVKQQQSVLPGAATATATATDGNGNGNGSATASQPVGAVLVCGGGVAGIQASLDLSAAGYRVYLVEESPTIGGGMARLDKTFPTGDCATCIISPKLVECMRDYNIDVLTMADVTRLEGEAGPFQGRSPQAAPQRRRQQVHRLRRLLAGLPGAERAAAHRADAAQRAAATPDAAAKLDEILARHAGKPGALMPVLHDIHAAHGYLPRLVLEHVASRWNVPGGRDPPRGQLLRRVPLRAGRPAPDRSLHRHVVLQPRLGRALGAAGKRTGHRARRNRQVGAVHAAHGPLPRALCPCRRP